MDGTSSSTTVESQAAFAKGGGVPDPESTTNPVHMCLGVGQGFYLPDAQSELLFPTIDVNGCATKSHFNLHWLNGCILCAAAVMIDGQRALVCGYGPPATCHHQVEPHFAAVVAKRKPGAFVNTASWDDSTSGVFIGDFGASGSEGCL